MELLTVIAVTGLLLALLLGAVQRSREVSRRLQCANNLRQFGVALHGFHERHGHFPHNGVNLGFSVHSQLLGDLDQGSLYAKIDHSTTPYQQLHRFYLENAVVPLFLCPSDLADPAGTNYRACHGSDVHNSAVFSGIFHGGKQAGAHDITDGMSFTVAMSERIRSDEDRSNVSLPADILGSGLNAMIVTTSSDEMRTACSLIPQSAPLGYNGFMGRQWINSAISLTGYNHIDTPNSRTSDCAREDLTTQTNASIGTIMTGMITARSYHSGGVNCLLGDGAVRLQAEQVDLNVWRALSTIAGGEVITSSF